MKNGYIVVENNTHHKSFDTGTGIYGVYEHVLIAESYVLGRPLQDGEVVHHLDGNRANNSPDNLLVLQNSMHTKLHGWLNKHTVTPTPRFQERMDRGCVRCKICEVPIYPTYIYCSHDCVQADNISRHGSLTKEALQRLVWDKPTVHVARDFNVSDTAIAKLCKKLGVEKPPRGYWAKKASLGEHEHL